MSSNLIVTGTASEIEDILMSSFKEAARMNDFQGTAALAKEMRKRQEAADKKQTRAEKKASASL